MKLKHMLVLIFLVVLSLGKSPNLLASDEPPKFDKPKIPDPIYQECKESDQKIVEEKFSLIIRDVTLSEQRAIQAAKTELAGMGAKILKPLSSYLEINADGAARYPLHIRIVVTEILADLFSTLNPEENKDDFNAVLYLLIKQLKDSNWQVREAATKSIGRNAKDTALPYLVEMLGDYNWRVKLAAVDGIGDTQTKDENIAKYFHHRLQKEYDQVIKVQLMVSLGKLQYKPALETLFSIFNDRENYSFDEYIHSFQAIYLMEDPMKKEIQDCMRDVLRQLSQPDQKQRDLIVKIMKTTGESALEPLIATLLSMSDPKAVACLESILSGIQGENVAKRLGEEIAKMDDAGLSNDNLKRLFNILRVRSGTDNKEKILAEIMKVTREAKSPRVQAAGVDTLTQEDLKSSDSRPLIIDLCVQETTRVEGPNEELLTNLVAYIYKNNNAEFGDPLIQILSIQTKINPKIRRDSANFLFSCATENHLEAMRQVFENEKDEIVQQSIFNAVERISKTVSTREMQLKVQDFCQTVISANVAVNPKVMNTALATIRNGGSAAASPHLQALVRKNTNEKVRLEALEILGLDNFYAESNEALFREVLENGKESSAVKSRAMQGLVQFSSPDVWNLLLETLRGNNDKIMTDRAKIALTQVEDERYAKFLAEALQDEKNHTKRAALEGIFGAMSCKKAPEFPESLKSFLEKTESSLAVSELGLAYTALAFQKDAKSAPIFKSALEQNDFTRYATAKEQALLFSGEMQIVDHKELILNHLKPGIKSSDIINAAIKAVGDLKDENGLDPLKEFLTSSYSDKVIQSLGHFKTEKADKMILDFLEKDARGKDDSKYIDMAGTIEEYCVERPDLKCQALAKALNTAPADSVADVDANMLMGLALRKMGEWQKSADSFTEARRLFKKLGLEASEEEFSPANADEEFAISQATAHIKAGKNAKAIEVMNQFLTEHQTGVDYNTAAWTLIELNVELEQGIAWARKAVELSRDELYIRDTLAWGLYLSWQKSKDAKTLEQAVEIQQAVVNEDGKGRADYRAHLAELYIQSGRLEDAWIHVEHVMLNDEYHDFDWQIRKEKIFEPMRTGDFLERWKALERKIRRLSFEN